MFIHFMILHKQKFPSSKNICLIFFFKTEDWQLHRSVLKFLESVNRKIKISPRMIFKEFEFSEERS